MLPPLRVLLADFAAGRTRPTELLERCHRTIERLDPAINALPTRRPLADCIAEALRIEAAIEAGEPVGPLAGLPYVAKDLFDTAGLRTTLGSPIFADRVPSADAPGVARLRAAGAVLIAKSNTPEFAAGSQTFNPIFGATRNPYDLAHTVGGSSGGAAAALATGMTVVADGSDLAASLRNPASFCGVVGLRPSTRLDPTLVDGPNAFDLLSTIGPMGRSVDDCRWVYRALFHPAPAQPLDRWVAAAAAQPAPRPVNRLRLAYSADLGGVPLAAPVRAAFEASLERLRQAGATLIEACPDFSGADEAFMSLRGLYFVEWLGELFETERDRMKETVVWNIEMGLGLDAARIARAQRLRSAVMRRMAAFLADADAFLLPTSQVLPFGLDTPYPTAINGVPLTHYVDWLKTCYWISASGHPALSLPCGLAQEEDGPLLPVGLQLVGRWGGEEALFEVAESVEAVLGPVPAPSLP